MSDSDRSHPHRAVAAAIALGRRLARWLRPGDRTERYLASATDHADLERRIRELERCNRGPALLTYNH